MSVCYSFFSLTAICQTRINLFVSLFLQNIRRPVLVSFKLELGICLIIRDVSLEFPPDFWNTEATFKRCSIKVVVQQNDVMKYSPSVPEVKIRKPLHVNLTKNCTPSQVFSKNMTTSSEQRYRKILLNKF